MVRALTIIVFILLWTSISQALSIQMEISDNQILLGDRFQISLKVLGDTKNLNPIFPEYLNLDEFATQLNSGISRSTRIMNGHVSSFVTKTYLFESHSIGKYRIEKIIVTLGQNKVSPDTIDLEVLDLPSSGGGGRNQASPNTVQEQYGRIWFIAEVDRINPFLDEQVVLTFKIYHQGNLEEYSEISISTLPNFWVETLSLIDQDERVLFRNQYYSVKEVARYAIFPNKVGKIRIDPIKLEAIVHKIYQSFFRRVIREKEVYISNPINLEVQPLPEYPFNFPNQLKGISGKILDLELEENLFTQKIYKKGRPLQVNLILSGDGNIALSGKPLLDFDQNSWELLDVLEDSTYNRSSLQLFGTKKISYILKPLVTSTSLALGDFIFPYFDVKEKQYKLKKISDLTFQISDINIGVILDTVSTDIPLESLFLIDSPPSFLHISQFFIADKILIIICVSIILLFIFSVFITFLWISRQQKKGYNANLRLFFKKILEDYSQENKYLEKEIYHAIYQKVIFQLFLYTSLLLKHKYSKKEFEDLKDISMNAGTFDQIFSKLLEESYVEEKETSSFSSILLNLQYDIFSERGLNLSRAEVLISLRKRVEEHILPFLEKLQDASLLLTRR